jgi:hypothetical protein
VEPIFRAFIFYEWNPVQMADIGPKYKEVIDTMFFQQNPEAQTNVTDNKKQSVAECRLYMKSLVDKWLQLFNADTLSESTLQQALSWMESNLWHSLATYYNFTASERMRNRKKAAGICILGKFDHGEFIYLD